MADAPGSDGAGNVASPADPRDPVEELDQRTRRINQLLGERNQLERQLSRAERAVQQLSQELGAARASAARTSASGTEASTLMRNLGNQLRDSLMRLGNRREALGRRPAAEPASAASTDHDGALVAFAQEGRQQPVMAVVVHGLAPGERENVLDLVTRQGSALGLLPLVLTDDDDFAPLRSRSLIFEYLPPPAVRERFAPGLEWELYLQRRLALIRRKWRPVRVIAFGRRSAELVQLWSDSPFEDRSLGRLPAAPPPGSTAERDGPIPTA